MEFVTGVQKLLHTDKTVWKPVSPFFLSQFSFLLKGYKRALVKKTKAVSSDSSFFASPFSSSAGAAPTV